VLKRALVRSIEIICEAVKKVPDETTTQPAFFLYFRGLITNNTRLSCFYLDYGTNPAGGSYTTGVYIDSFNITPYTAAGGTATATPPLPRSRCSESPCTPLAHSRRFALRPRATACLSQLLTNEAR
jgi:hypothetical protein